MRLADFLSELRRRHVGRVAIAYGITAWALVQVADVVFPRLALPDWIVTLLIVVALAGFPVALVLAWAYDVVPDPAGATGQRGAGRLRPGPRAIGFGLAGAVLLLTAAGALRVWPELMDDSARIESIAVLPFDNLSSDAEQEYFVAGMHDALITELAQIGALRVLSRSSTLRYRNSEQSLADIARELGVDGVVEGSVLKVGSELRMQVQLIQPSPRERHVWAESYERTVDEVPRLHGDIVRTIASEIGAHLTPDEEARLQVARTVDPRAYEAYLRGMYFLSRQTPDDYRLGLDHLQQAIALDPANPDAYAGLALGYSVVGHGTVPDAFTRAQAAARRALELDPTVAAAHEALAEIALYHDWDFDEAERSFRRALSLNPNLAEAAGHYGWYHLVSGRTDDALAWERRAASLDPLNALWPAWVGWIHLWTESHDSALAWAQSALDLNPAHPHALYVAGYAAAQLGATEDAMALADQLEAMPPFRWGAASIHAALGHADRARDLAAAIEAAPGPMDAFGLGVVYAQIGEKERALEWLRRAAEQRFSWIPWLHRAHELRALRGDPDFEALLREVGLRQDPLALGS